MPPRRTSACGEAAPIRSGALRMQRAGHQRRASPSPLLAGVRQALYATRLVVGRSRFGRPALAEEGRHRL